MNVPSRPIAEPGRAGAAFAIARPPPRPRRRRSRPAGPAEPAGWPSSTRGRPHEQRACPAAAIHGEPAKCWWPAGIASASPREKFGTQKFRFAGTSAPPCRAFCRGRWIGARGANDRPFAAIGAAGHHAELDVGDIAQLADRVGRGTRRAERCPRLPQRDRPEPEGRRFPSGNYRRW